MAESVSLLKRHLKGPWKPTLFDSVDSTNTLLLAKVKSGEADAHSVYLANSQTGGRGRLGRSFASPDGGIYMSFCAEDAAFGLSTVTAAVAVSKALEKFGYDPKIKWVNDIYLGDKKVCGILAQSVGDGKRAVIGIGINLKTAAIPSELSDIATALDSFSDVIPEKALIVAEILNGYENLSGTLPEGRENIIAQYRERLLMLGEKVTVLQTGETVTAKDVDSTGALIAITEDNKTIRLNSGEISIRKIITN